MALLASMTKRGSLCFLGWALTAGLAGVAGATGFAAATGCWAAAPLLKLARAVSRAFDIWPPVWPAMGALGMPPPPNGAAASPLANTGPAEPAGPTDEVPPPPDCCVLIAANASHGNANGS